MSERTLRRVAIAGMAPAMLVVVGLIAWAPAGVGFVAAGSVALVWCWWSDAHHAG